MRATALLLLVSAALPTTGRAQPLDGPVAEEGNMRGAVEFVVGNDLFQPGEQFAAGDDWLALACAVARCTLEPATLSVEPASWTGRYDDEPTLGQRLKFERAGGGDAVAWLHTREAPAWLAAGPVETFHSPDQPIVRPPNRGNSEAMIDLPGNRSALLVPLWADPAAGPVLVNGVEQSGVYLQLRIGERRQLLLDRLGVCNGTFDPRTYLPWVGDLDRDGAPDFLVSFVDADGFVHLYLSSFAAFEQIVGLAGLHLSPPFGGECDGGGAYANEE